MLLPKPRPFTARLFPLATLLSRTRPIVPSVPPLLLKKKMMNLLLLPRTQPMVQIVPPLLITMMR